MQTKFYLENDDFGFLLEGLDNLKRLKVHWPDFKMTCFTIPLPKEFFYGDNSKQFSKEKYMKWAEIINELDWIEIAMHGFVHTQNEFDCTYEKAKMMLEASENLWEEIGLKYVKIFRAPYWQYSYDAFNALKDKGYTVAVDRNHPRTVPEGLKTYEYNWSFEEPLFLTPKNLEKINYQVKGHGHAFETGGSKNAISTCYGNIIKRIPAGAQFGFLSEIL